MKVIASLYFPKPTGQYAVGVKTYHWIDSNRKETLHDDPAHPNRELMINIWYPAQGKLAEKPTTPYVPYLVKHFKENQKLVSFESGISCSVYSYAKPKSSIVPDISCYPVIIFSHGCQCTRDGYTAMCEELASHGYFVVGVSHTFYSNVVLFPDGRIADGKKSLEKRWKNKNLIEILRQIDQEIEIWISDIHFVLDQLEQLNRDKKSVFYGRFDQTRIGMFGHSLGGGTTVQICHRDPRIKAGVALEGFLLGTDATKNIGKPFMFMLAGDGVKTFERSWTQNDWKKFGMSSLDDEKIYKSYYLPAIELFAKSIGHNVNTFVVKNSGHLDFGDIAFFKNSTHFWRNLMISDMADGAFGIGSIDGFRMTEIVNAYLVNFFGKQLKGKPSDLLDGRTDKYVEVEKRH